jgi:two-component sensor histidine kinase/FixJ family two-component response regulator
MRLPKEPIMPEPTNPPVVLVVEDEMVLRMRAVDVVEDAGFTPVEAVSADEAISILESRDDISLLFTDIQMPGTMDGLKLAHAAHARWPHIKIILVSGQVAVNEGDKPSDSKFFAKPFEVENMISELRGMVGKGTLEVLPSPPVSRESDELLALTTENDSLKLALEQAGIDAKALLVQAGIDAEERDAAGKLQHLIHAELHHRIKNILATVGAITHQSLRTATSMAHASSAIDGRFAALARAHDLLTLVSWENATIDSTVRSAIEPFDQGVSRFLISGENVGISSSAVIAFAMTLNELCTNATKFGALSVPDGQVRIDWRVEGDRFHFDWVESGGPVVIEPKRRSFGTRLMTSLGQQLNGKVELRYEPGGFTYALNVPLELLATKAKVAA